jgi:hypothetical protein
MSDGLPDAREVERSTGSPVDGFFMFPRHGTEADALVTAAAPKRKGSRG